LPRSAHRVSPVDWERAPIGSPYFDLAFLTHGLDDEFLEACLRQYRREASAYKIEVPALVEMRARIDFFVAFGMVTWLSRAHERYSQEKVARLTDGVRSIVDRQGSEAAWGSAAPSPWPVGVNRSHLL